ncbi:MAG: hypothetical protein ACI4JC_07960 [Faecalibacterium sp.]
MSRFLISPRADAGSLLNRAVSPSSQKVKVDVSFRNSSSGNTRILLAVGNTLPENLQLSAIFYPSHLYIKQSGK